MEHTNDTKEKNIKESILEKISEKKVTMRPKVYFTLRVLALGVLALIVLVLSVFIIGMMFFTFRISNHAALIGFGLGGIIVFLKLFPWWALLFDILALIVLLKLLRKFSFGYRRPVLYLLGSLLLFSIGAGAAIDRQTQLNDRMFMRASNHELSEPFGSIYMQSRRLPRPIDGLCRCRVVTVRDESLDVIDTKPGATTIFTMTIPDTFGDSFTEGDILFIAGDEKDGVITPNHIRVVPDRDQFFIKKTFGMPGTAADPMR